MIFQTATSRRRGAAAVCAAMLLAPAAAVPQAPDYEPLPPADAPRLLDLAQRTVRMHPQVLAAEAAVEASQALLSAAERPIYNPELLLNWEDKVFDTRIVGVSQTLDFTGLREGRTAVARRERESTEARLTAMRRGIAGELLRLLGEYWTAASQDELAETRISLMRSFADLTLQRSLAGDLTQVELNSANLAYAQAEIAHATAESARAGADQSLRAVVPVPVSAEWPLLPLELPPVSIDDARLERLIDALPQLQALRLDATAAQATVDLRNRERRPNPTVAFEAGEEDHQYRVGLSVSLPLHVRNDFSSEVAAAIARHSQAEMNAENAEIRARRSILRAGERYRHTREAWESWLRTGTPSLEQQSELLEQLMLAGELSTTEYLVQLNQTLDVAMNALELRRELWMSWFEWLAASGEVEAWLDINI